MNTKEKIEVMQAYEDGEEIEVSNKSCDSWHSTCMEVPAWNWPECDYRVKPKEKVKLYKYAYVNPDGIWTECDAYYRNDSEWCSKLPMLPKFQRLDYTMIEVDE